MSPQGKRLFMNSIIVITVMLFIFGYFIGKGTEETENQAVPKQKAETNVKDNEGFSYSDLNNDTDSDDKGTNEVKQSEEGKPMDNTADIDPMADYDPNAKREVSILADFYTAEQINAAKDVAKLFIENYYPFNGGQPTEHIEKTGPYVTEELKGKITGQIVRPTSNYYSRNIIKLEIYEPYNPAGDMILNARVEGEVFNSKGGSVKKEVVEYEIKLVLFENTFKVAEYTYTTLNRGDKENAE